MKTHLRLIAFAAFTTLSSPAFAQTDPHHPAADAPQPTTAAPAAQAMPDGLPEQCTAMMSTMQKMMPMMEKMAPMMQQMMPMMQQMMQGGMMQGGQGGMMQGQGGMARGGGMMNMPMDTANMSEASKKYVEAMKRMDAPMMQGIQTGDPDVAFVQAMIPHHQGAIDMARAVLQFGKDDQVKVWANQIITAQQAEIAAMQEWLKQHAK
ncbi:DUF305 domain-containing protein [Mesorhizobium sp. M7A.F.Ca.US.011.01.1.1]|uniref:CopM family metallochaperone n=1 Tax=Mesorhizobium sp. M7A.F.Ca.US.011.01.1.1 TaxID=2496741 RepID=UPI000FCB0584|nr:DUF305 domain-containing protein [Mesorhizobium sp. M7A.F.Ca.US.011.01.1.1]RUX25255.1 DUF305 domain-containing protein [Mesorhizobium sp. M7A.F.Ca.US.011.01.1.1]